ncbi:MAG TPA: methyltransferase, TIGR04325 family [Vicinamibacterales bacterium]|jgi:putative methyltransferase (TIGR04325 family)
MSTAPDRSRSSERVEIWEGIYASYQEAAAHVVGPGFDGDVWRTRSLASAQGCLAALEAGKPIPQFHKQRSALLPAVAAVMLASRDRLRVLDFGGGLGIGYMTLAESIPSASTRIDYTIVEVPTVCEEGRRLFSGSVRYATALPAGDTFDLVHAASAVQYVEDWKQLLKRLGGCGAEFMLLSDVFAGAIPTFVSLQNYYESRIRHWFFNLEELLDACSRAGYSLVMKTFAPSRRLGVEDAVPMDRFPDSHRLEQSLHLLLHRDS